MKFFSALPYTDAERERDREGKRRAQKTLHIRRKALKSGQNYSLPGTKATKARDERLLGESQPS